MKIKKTELQESIKTLVRKKLQEGADFSAKRRIGMLAAQVSLEFENTIVKELGLMHPDQMQEVVQRKYLQIVQTMKDKVHEAALDATNQLALLPRENKEI